MNSEMYTNISMDDGITVTKLGYITLPFIIDIYFYFT